jgi:1-acyl-sn-glycerol-3-phosphate acyltransferase
MKKPRVVYYHDALNDDFAGTRIKRKNLPPRFKYIHRNPLWVALSWIFYYGLAGPILWCATKVVYGLKVVGRKKIKKTHLSGYFIYGNHTQVGDAFFAATNVTPPRRTYIVANPDAVSIPMIRSFVMMLGCLPLPSTVEEREKFISAIEFRYHKGDAIVIYPEAHIWPYCTRIRPFADQNFTYPAKLSAPVYAMCTTYEERRFLKFLPPRAVIHISDPIYPNSGLPLGERAHELREAVYAYMVDVSSSLDNVEYVRYLKAPSSGETPQK